MKKSILFLLLICLIFSLSSCILINKGSRAVLADSTHWKFSSEQLFKNKQSSIINNWVSPEGYYTFSNNQIDVSIYCRRRVSDDECYFTGPLVPVIPFFLIKKTIDLFQDYRLNFEYRISCKSKDSIVLNNFYMIFDGKDTVRSVFGRYSYYRFYNWWFSLKEPEYEVIDGYHCYSFVIVSQIEQPVKKSVEIVFDDVQINNNKVNIPSIKILSDNYLYVGEEMHKVIR